MPPPLPLPLGSSAAGRGLSRLPRRADSQSICFFCSLSRPATTRRPRRKALNSRRLESTAAATSTARKELEDALVDLQKHAANYVNLSRLQLALNGLRQQPGKESIRVAILGLTDGTNSGKTAKQVLKLLLADPLKEEEDWEREVDKHDLTQPMILRVGAEEYQEPGTISLTKGNLLHEVNVSSATLNGHNLELLLMETNPYASDPRSELETLEDSVLVPRVDIPTSSTGRYTPITTPVHKALLVENGFRGVMALASMPLLESQDVIKAAVNLPEYKSTDSTILPFTPLDVETASLGLGLIRKDLQNAMEFEHLWFESNVPKLVEWLKADILSTPEHTTKPPVRRLVASLLENASASIHGAEVTRLSKKALASTESVSTTHLKTSLAEWAENAHGELQEMLHRAFASRRWRKLGWWKLFWRVDDVHMLSTDILNQRFLPNAERTAIFLKGRIAEATKETGYTAVDYYPSTSGKVIESEPSLKTPPIIPGTGDDQFLMDIPATRANLQFGTIPALQALAQKLVAQTLATSGLTTSLGALVYFGTLTTGLYEAGAVAALGIVWSMRRMQKQWEAAREFWEGEVREAGRKAVRCEEMGMGKVLDLVGSVKDSKDTVEDGELERAKQLIEKATDALKKLR